MIRTGLEEKRKLRRRTLNLITEKLWQDHNFNGQDKMAALIETEENMSGATNLISLPS